MRGGALAEETRWISRLVADGYDRISEPYARLGERTGWGARPRYLKVLLDRLAPGSRVLDLGCGAGVPVASTLARSHDVVAVDISFVQAGSARRRVLAAACVVADMADVAFADRSFDAVACFYALTHVPRRLHLDVLRRIRRWLRPGGIAVVTMGEGDHPDAVASDFLGMGAPMFVSHFDADTNRALVARSGLRLVQAHVDEQADDGDVVRFCWVVAERPR